PRRPPPPHGKTPRRALGGFEPRSAGRRTGSACRRAALHRLFAGLPRRALRHETAAARPLPDAGQSCRLTRPPGRFLMPSNLAGSPSLTFAPLDLPKHGAAVEGSLWAMMRRRYEAYKDVV